MRARLCGNLNPKNITAVLFLRTILPGCAAASYMLSIVLERPLFVRCAPAAMACTPLLPCDWCIDHSDIAAQIQ